MEETDRRSRRRQGFEEGPVVDGAVGDGRGHDVRPHPPDVRDLQRRLVLGAPFRLCGIRPK